MTNYQVAIGHNATASLADISFQPSSDGAKYPERIETVNGSLYDDGSRFIELVFRIIQTGADARGVLQEFGLWDGSNTSNTANVTLYAPISMPRVWKNWNGVAVLPRINETAEKTSPSCWFSDFIIIVRELEDLS